MDVLVLGGRQGRSRPQGHLDPRNAEVLSAEVQAFTTGRAVGKLHVVPLGTPYESLLFDRHDIVLLQESYPDITPVAGILATAFSTPLSHVNLRAGAWGIPNAGDKKARDKYAKLDGRFVYYEVNDTGMILRDATAAELKEAEGRIAARLLRDLLKQDLSPADFACFLAMIKNIPPETLESFSR